MAQANESKMLTLSRSRPLGGQVSMLDTAGEFRNRHSALLYLGRLGLAWSVPIRKCFRYPATAASCSPRWNWKPRFGSSATSFTWFGSIFVRHGALSRNCKIWAGLRRGFRSCRCCPVCRGLRCKKGLKYKRPIRSLSQLRMLLKCKAQ